MPEEIYISKSLIKKVVTFLNEYVDNKDIVFKIAKFPEYIYVCISICKLRKNNSIDFCIDSIDDCIDTEEKFIKYKQKVLNQLPLLLKQVKTN